MKVSKLQASDNRDAIVQAAAEQIRGRGFALMSVAEVAKAAGLTHGALYSHFGSKDALQTQALRRAFADCLTDFSGLTAQEFLGRYLSEEHRDNPEHGCPAAALVSEVRWQSDQSRTAFRDGFDGFATLIGDSLRLHDKGKDLDLDKAILMYAAMVGGLAMSRAVRDIDEAASKAILQSVLAQLQKLVEPAARPSPRKTARSPR